MDQPQVGVEDTLLSSSLLAPLFSQITDNQRLKIFILKHFLNHSKIPKHITHISEHVEPLF